MLFWIQIKMTQFYRGSVDAQAGLRIFRSNMTKQIFSKQGAFDNGSFRNHMLSVKSLIIVIVRTKGHDEMPISLFSETNNMKPSQVYSIAIETDSAQSKLGLRCV